MSTLHRCVWPVMVTHHTRETVRERTLQDLRAASIRPTLEIDNRPRPDLNSAEARAKHDGHRVPAKRALDQAAHHPATLWLEDDLIVKPDFARWVNRAHDLGRDAVYCLLDEWSYPSPVSGMMHNDGAPPTPIQQPGFATLARPNFYWGAQALLLQRRTIREVLERWDAMRCSIDMVLRDVWDDRPFNERPLVALPNPVQHQAPPSVIRRRYTPPRSRLCDLPIHPTGEPIPIQL